MLFNSVNFFVFLVIVVSLFWLLNAKHRWILLLITSYFFYAAWEPVYIILIGLSTGIDFFISNHWTSSENKKTAKRGLTASILMNLGLLFSFKYYNFFQESMSNLFDSFGLDYTYAESNLLLPVGISFYTFQTMSYSIDVYRKTIKPEKNLGKFALFVAFFPQLVAGPIERAKHLLPQLNNLNQSPKWKMFQEGGRLILYGLFKKVVIADNCAHWVDLYYGNIASQNGGVMLFATLLFAIQLYTDFSGYSDIAIGTAKMLGIKLNINFRTPYFSRNFQTFWHNWHISLSNWMKDYIYIPLGGNRVGKTRTHLNLITTMTVSGLWHGASWNFAIWGFINGIFLSVEKMLFNRKKKSFWIVRALSASVVFFLFTLTLVFFRSPSFSDSILVFSKLGQFEFFDFYFILGDNKFTPAILCSIVLFACEALFAFKSFSEIGKLPTLARYSLYFVLVALILLFGNSVGKPFIYFQF